MKRYDSYEKRCPILGHQIQFSYCRQSEEEKPCSRILSCWSNSLPIHTYISKFFGPDDIQRLKIIPKNKMYTIIDLINKIKEKSSPFK